MGYMSTEEARRVDGEIWFNRDHDNKMSLTIDVNGYKFPKKLSVWVDEEFDDGAGGHIIDFSTFGSSVSINVRTNFTKGKYISISFDFDDNLIYNDRGISFIFNQFRSQTPFINIDVVEWYEDFRDLVVMSDFIVKEYLGLYMKYDSSLSSPYQDANQASNLPILGPVMRGSNIGGAMLIFDFKSRFYFKKELNLPFVWQGGLPYENPNDKPLSVQLVIRNTSLVMESPVFMTPTNSNNISFYDIFGELPPEINEINDKFINEIFPSSGGQINMWSDIKYYLPDYFKK